MKVIVTGATGFLGFRLCEMLLERKYEVIALGRNLNKGEKLNQIGCRFIKVDLQNKDEILNALKESVDGIIHSAALSSPWGELDTFLNINQQGTKNLVEAAEENNVPRFVFISSPSVYFNFKERLNVKESEPTAKPNWPSNYTYSKYLAEKEVLKSQGMKRVILRPRGLFGPGDTSIIPRLVKANKEGRLPIIGNGETLTDLTYIDNAAYSAILALENCDNNDGEIFNISNGEPIELWSYLADLFKDLNLEYNPKKVPFFIVYYVCFFSELLSKYILTNKEPTLTRYTAGLLAKSLTLDITKAKKKLGYTPLVSMAEGKKRLLSWIKENEGKE